MNLLMESLYNLPCERKEIVFQTDTDFKKERRLMSVYRKRKLFEPNETRNNEILLYGTRKNKKTRTLT